MMPKKSTTLAVLILVLVMGPIMGTGHLGAATLSDIRVAFKLDPRLTGGEFMGERWVSPDTFTGYQIGTEFTVEVRAEGMDDQGAPVDVSPEWIAADPDIVTVSPSEGGQVTLTVLQAGMTTMTVTSQGISRELFIEATYLDIVIKVEISQIMPVEVEFIPYPPTADPVMDSTQVNARPVAVGPAAQGGNITNIRVVLDPFAGAIDVFFGVYAPAALGSDEILLLRRDNTFRPLSAGFIPWKTGVSAPIDESLFGNIAVSTLPPGIYHLLLLVAPAADSALQEAFLWQTAVGAGTVVDMEASLTGLDVVDPVETAGSGMGFVSVVLETREVVSTLSFNNLTSGVTGAHIHKGDVGTNGPIIVNFTGPIGVTSATWTAPMDTVLTPEQLDALVNDGLYFQIHTQQNPAGELRGQIPYPPGAPLP